MINIKNHKQQQIFDPWSHLGPKRRKLLDESWAGLFRKDLLPVLPIEKLIPFFDAGFGRPTKELYTSLGTLLFQQINDLTDEEACNQLAFNIQWHYALNLPEESDAIKYMCPKTLWSMRNILVKNSIDVELFEAIRDKLARVFKVKTDSQRIDSVHIKSNMRKLGRIGIFVSGISKFLKNLKRNHKEQFGMIEGEIVDKYLSEKGKKSFSMIKPSDSHKTLSEVSNDLFYLVEKFRDCAPVTGMDSYKLLVRILNEQCNVTASGNETQIEVKKPKDIPSDSLQNPSDPDATYSGHKGQGYQVQIMETYTKTKDEAEKAQTLNLITHVEVEQSHKSDANALIPAIEETKEQGLAAKEVLADSLYGSDENCQTAKELEVDVLAPVMGRKKDKDNNLSEFQFNETGDVVKCPSGNSPVKTHGKKSRHSACFNKRHCSKCDRSKGCPVKESKKYYYLRYTDRELRVALRRTYENTDEFIDRYRWRAGVEATMSEYDRKTGVKQLRVRGLGNVRFSSVLKAAGINIFRATAVRKAIIVADIKIFAKNYIFSVVKERVLEIYKSVSKFLSDFGKIYDCECVF
jgi:hypothetical protein